MAEGTDLTWVLDLTGRPGWGRALNGVLGTGLASQSPDLLKKAEDIWDLGIPKDTGPCGWVGLDLLFHVTSFPLPPLLSSLKLHSLWGQHLPSLMICISCLVFIRVQQSWHSFIYVTPSVPQTQLNDWEHSGDSAMCSQIGCGREEGREGTQGFGGSSEGPWGSREGPLLPEGS